MNERFVWAIIRINAREEHFLDFLIPKFSWENGRTRENRGDSSENDNLKKSSIMWREHMFIYAACLRRNFNYCSILSLQLILIQDFIEKEWKDNGRDKCTGPGASADIGRGNLYVMSCQCVWVCPHPESIRGQFHPAPQCSPTLVICIFSLEDVKNQGEDSYKMHHFRLHDNHNGVQHLSRWAGHIQVGFFY